MISIISSNSLLRIRFSSSTSHILLLLYTLAMPISAETVDQRQIIKLTDAQRAHVLVEMQDMLSGTQMILAALADNNMTVVTQQARLLGVKKGAKAEDSLHHLLPKEFKQLGMSVHRSFDQIAADAETFNDREYTLRQMSRTLVTCNVCHQTYQIQVESPSISLTNPNY